MAKPYSMDLHREGLSSKKRGGQRARPARRRPPSPAVARRRAQWKTHQGRIAPSRFVFIDETWAKTNMAPLRGWGRRGERLRAKVPHGRWRTMTFLAGLRSDRIVAPWIVDGPINGATFRVYVERVLVPTLAPGDIVVMGQPRQPQKPRDPRRPSQGRREALLPAALQPRPEPDRAGLRQAEAPAPQSGRAHPRGHLATDRRPPRPLRTRGVRQLSRQRRLRFLMNASRSWSGGLVNGIKKGDSLEERRMIQGRRRCSDGAKL